MENNYSPSILIVDDEPLVRQILFDVMSDEFSCEAVGSAEEALAAFESRSFELVISDINLGGMSGVELIPRIKEISPDTVVMMISGDGTMDSAIASMREGAFDYLRKPFALGHVSAAVSRALEYQELLASKRRYEEDLTRLVEERTARLHHVQYHDRATDLPNRALLEDRLGQLIVGNQPDGKIALLLVHLERLRKIRETLGDEIATSVLLEAVTRIREHVKFTVTIGRMDEDTVALLIPNAVAENLVKLAGLVTESVGKAMSVGGHNLFVETAIGISVHPDDGQDVPGLFRNALSALAKAREAGQQAMQFFTAEISEAAATRLALENDLRCAIERNELEVHYQPKINVESGTLYGAEALVRWRRPSGGLVPPGDFIPLAEEIGLIGSIGEWVMRRACEDAKAWADAGSPLSVAVNLSGRQLHPGLSYKVRAVLEDTGLDPSLLNLEITESSIMSNVEEAVEVLSAVRGLGVEVSIDDFGTGYSSLSMLRQLPIDVLKIDRTFIRDASDHPDDAALVMTIVNLAHNLRLKVVAEGVETEQQLSLLRLLRCDEYQGFLYSRPLPKEEFVSLIRND